MLYYCKYLLFISITWITKKLSNLEHAACQNGLTLLFLTFHFYSGNAFGPVMSPICIITIIKWSLKSAVQLHTHQGVNYIIVHTMDLQNQPACENTHACFPPYTYLKKYFSTSGIQLLKETGVILKALLLRMFCFLVVSHHLWLVHSAVAYSMQTATLHIHHNPHSVSVIQKNSLIGITEKIFTFFLKMRYLC